MDTLAINTLLETANDLFSLVAKVRHPTNKDLSETEFYQQVIEQLNQFNAQLQLQGFNEAIIKKATYGLVAYIDELVLLSSWPGRKAWMSKTLQWKFFNEHLAGERFFDRLTEIRQAGEAQADLLELYYVCLQFGFTGMYRLKGEEARQALLVALKSQLTQYKKLTSLLLSDDAVLQTNFLRRLGQSIPYWSIFSVTAALLFFIYSGFALTMRSHSNDSIAQLKTYQTQLINIFAEKN